MTGKATNTQYIPQSMMLSCTHNFIEKFVAARTMKNYYEFKNKVHQKKEAFFSRTLRNLDECVKNPVST